MTPLEKLHQEISACKRCPLAVSRTRAVPGEGPENPEIVFIGEAPGFHEDQQGRPFVGPAGQFLEELLAAIGLRRKDVYITNIIKSRPPGNRDPLPGEIEACRPWLEKQVELLRPKIVVTLGRYSLAHFFPKDNISKVHGKARKKNGVIFYAMYHPAAALHQPGLRNTIIEDMKRIPELLAQADKIQEEEEKKPEQLSML